MRKQTRARTIAVSIALMLSTLFSLVAPAIAGKPFYEPVYVNGHLVWMNAIEMPHETPDPSHADLYVFASGPPPPSGPPPVFQYHVVDSEPGDPWYSPLWNVEVVMYTGTNTYADLLTHLGVSVITSAEQVHQLENDGLIWIFEPGEVFLCAIVNENAVSF